MVSAFRSPAAISPAGAAPPCGLALGVRSCENIDCIKHGGTEGRVLLTSSQCLCVSAVRALFGSSFTPS